MEAALEIWRSLEGDRGVDAVGAVRLAHNIAVCVCDLGRPAEAIEPLRRCAAELASLGLRTEATRGRWKLGTALLLMERVAEAEAVLRESWRTLTDLGMTVDAALAALDLAEALVASEELEEVPAICREVIEHLTSAGLATRTLPALALLREAAAMGRASREMVRAARGAVGMGR